MFAWLGWKTASPSNACLCLQAIKDYFAEDQAYRFTITHVLHIHHSLVLLLGSRLSFVKHYILAIHTPNSCSYQGRDASHPWYQLFTLSATPSLTNRCAQDGRENDVKQAVFSF